MSLTKEDGNFMRKKSISNFSGRMMNSLKISMKGEVPKFLINFQNNCLKKGHQISVDRTITRCGRKISLTQTYLASFAISKKSMRGNLGQKSKRC